MQTFSVGQIGVLLGVFAERGLGKIPGTWLSEASVDWGKVDGASANAVLDTRYYQPGQPVNGTWLTDASVAWLKLDPDSVHEALDTRYYQPGNPLDGSWLTDGSVVWDKLNALSVYTVLDARYAGEAALASGTVTVVPGGVAVSASKPGYRKYDVWLTDAAAPDSPQTLVPPGSVPGPSFSVVSDENGLYNLSISGTVLGVWYVHVSFGASVVSAGPVTVS